MREKEAGRPKVNRATGGIESSKYSGFSLAELGQSLWLSCGQARRVSLSFSCWALLWLQVMTAPSSGLSFTWRFLFINFYIPLFRWLKYRF